METSKPGKIVLFILGVLAYIVDLAQMS
jgi:hypothetical protein